MLSNITSQKIGIFYKDVEWAKKVWDDVVSGLFPNLIAEMRKFKDMRDSIIVLNNGTKIRFVEAVKYSKGCKFDKAYYQPEIDDNFIRDIVMSTVATRHHFPLSTKTENDSKE